MLELPATCPLGIDVGEAYIRLIKPEVLEDARKAAEEARCVCLSSLFVLSYLVLGIYVSGWQGPDSQREEKNRPRRRGGKNDSVRKRMEEFTFVNSTIRHEGKKKGKEICGFRGKEKDPIL